MAARLTNTATGVTVVVDDALAATLGGEWQAEGALPSGTPGKSWKVPQLKAYAAEHDIDLGGATTKDDILAAITAALDEASKSNPNE